MDLKLNFYEIDFEKIPNDKYEECENVWVNMWEVGLIGDIEEKFIYKIVNHFKSAKQIIFINYKNIMNHSRFEDTLEGFDNTRMLEK